MRPRVGSKVFSHGFPEFIDVQSRIPTGSGCVRIIFQIDQHDDCQTRMAEADGSKVCREHCSQQLLLQLGFEGLRQLPQVAEILRAVRGHGRGANPREHRGCMKLHEPNRSILVII